jgi:putative glycosyltransferase (TIGR04372 family)
MQHVEIEQMTFKKTILFLQPQVRQIQKGGIPVLWYKLNILLNRLIKKLLVPFYHLAVFLKFNWAYAYYFVGIKLAKRYYRIRMQSDQGDGFGCTTGNRAIAYLKKAIAIKPDLSFPRYGLSQYLTRLLSSMLKADESFEMMHRITELQSEIIKARQMEKLDIEFVPRSIALGNIGVYSFLDAYIKAGILGLRPPKKLILLVPSESPVNNLCYLNYWRRYVTVISDPLTIRYLAPLERYLTNTTTDYICLHDYVLPNNVAIGVANRQWEVENHPPVLTLSTEDYERGWNCLKSLGVPEGAWFVCLHVRGHGWNDGGSSSEDYRNCDIETYFSAIKTIVEAGGWVVRIGDPISMTPLPPMKNVIDYVHSDAKSDWMDVFCCAQCRFIVGTSSGMWPISSAFGVPLVMTNLLPTVLTFTFFSQDIFIPKLCWSIKENRYQSFRELLTLPQSLASSQFSYDSLGLRIEGNTAEDINEVVKEMLARLDNKSFQYTEENELLQDRFKSMAAGCGTLHGHKGVGVYARIGNDFLSKNEHLLADCGMEERKYV